jgi:nitroimidazol reductase NimA-like FMN-containing flavoprotein (pyridoxamine 5'-phosphate oxidase superfamily)
MTATRLPDHIAAMLERAWVVRVATAAADGSPTVAPFWFHFDGERIVLDTLENATVRNVRRDGRVAVLVDEGRLFDELRTATIAGSARSFDPEAAPPAVIAAIEEIRARHADELVTPVFESYAARETRASVYVEITPDSARYWSPAG